MRIGILQTGETPPGLREKYGRYPQMFVALFARAGVAAEWGVFDVRRRRFPKRPAEFDGFIITGSRHGVYEPLPWIPLLMEQIQTLHRLRVPMVGVCFGHQAIAQALGGRVVQSPKGWGAGLQKWDILRKAEWMKNTPRRLSLLSCHQDQVVRQPRGAVRLFSSGFCANAGFMMGSRVFTLQGHPEFTAEFSRALTRRRSGDLPPAVCRAALATAGGRHDGELCAKWMGAFFAAAAK